MSAAVRPDQRFSKSRRLLRSSEFRSVIRHNKRSKDSFFIIYFKSNGLNHSRLGVTVSRKAARRAIDRNRIKRTIKESFRRQRHPPAGVDIVAIARPRAQRAWTDKLLPSLENHWKTASEANRCKSL